MNSDSQRIRKVSIWWDAVQTHIDAYLIQGTFRALIDTGPPQPSLDPVTLALKPHDVTPGDIDLILNTHGHIDHIGANGLVGAAGSRSVMIHQDDAVFIEDPGRSFDLFYAPGKENVEEKKAGFLTQMVPGKVDRYLADMDRIGLGDGMELRVIHLPGHTPGSVGFYWEKEAILICGDAVPCLSTPGGSLPIIYDLAAYEKSIERLSGMPIKSIFFSHPYRGLRLPPSAVRTGSDVTEYLADSRRVASLLREAVLKEAAVQGTKSLMEMADDIIGSLPPEMGFLKTGFLPAPEFSLGTIVCALAQAGKG